MAILFNIDEVLVLKRTHPDWVILFGDKAKNPSRIVGSWKDLTCQSMDDLVVSLDKAKCCGVDVWNFGPRTGLGGLACLDWDWEFLAYGWMKCFGDRAKTLTFRTPNLGYRMLYLTAETENNSPYKRSLHMEFENGGYVAVGGFAEDIEGQKQPYTKVFNSPIRVDDHIIADTKAFLTKQQNRYDFLRYNCVNLVVDRKHIRLDHSQRLAIVQFMVGKEFSDDEIHDFFRAVYGPSGREYDFGITQSQIASARGFHVRGGRPNPCSAKSNPENGHVSTPLFQIFSSDNQKCRNCIRKFSVKKDSIKEAHEHELEEVLDWLRGEYIFKTPTDLRDLYYYCNGIYKPAECLVEGLLEQRLGARASRHFVCEVLEHLRRGSYVDRSEFNCFRGYVPLFNGLLDLKSLELKPFDADVIYTYKLNAKFDPTAASPKWSAFLSQILPLEDHLLLQEYLGYCLLPTMPKHKIMWFYGGGRNGKGRVIKTLEAIIGQDNCSYIEVGEFDGEHRFAVAQLYGKLVNVSSEPSTAVALQTPLLKKITGEDSLDAEVKGKQKRLCFCNVAKPFVLGNEFPKICDSSTAFHERTLILKFPNTFTGKNQIDDVERLWLDDPVEVSGILNWMLTGLHRLWANNDFTVSKTTQEVTLEFKRTSDPIGAWIEDRCVFNVDGFVSRKAAFEDYKAYADEELGRAPETERKFYQRLRDTPRVKDFDTKHEGRGFRGLCLKIQPKSSSSVSQQVALVLDPAAAGSKNFLEKIAEGVSGGFVECDKSATAAASETKPEQMAGCVDAARTVFLIERSEGEPCEGATSGGGDCGFASEYYLIDGDGQRSTWCRSHLRSVLSGYDQRNYEFRFGSGCCSNG